MPTNKLIYFGVIVIAASALLWVGAWLARRAEWILPYTGIAGVLLVLIGLFLELKRKEASVLVESPAAMEPSSVSVTTAPKESTPVEPN